ncbi:hypothetical protein ABPG75_010454 [Micractinium tetrahymenae]
MSARHYEELWRQGVTELVGLLDAEHPEDRAAAPKKPEDWTKLYVLYVQTFCKLCAAHDGLAHPQKRAALRATLEACLGRLLELRAWLAQLAGGCDVLDLTQQLAELQLTPDVLELPVPAYFREARAEALAARAAAAAAAVEAAARAGRAAAGADGLADVAAEVVLEHVREGEKQAAAGAGKAEVPRPEVQPAAGTSPASSPHTEHASFSQPDAPAHQQQQGQQEQQHQQQQAVAAEEDAPPAEPEDAQQAAWRASAATAVQAGVRGWLARRRVAAERQRELEFLGMAPPADGGRSEALAGRLAAVATRRKQLQGERLADMNEAMVGIKAAVRQREGWSMKERIRDKLSDWFLKSREPETAQYGDLPDAAKGGSRDIIYPKPPEATPEEAAATAAAANKAAAAARKGGKGGKGGKGAAPEAPRMTAAFLQDLQAAVQRYMDVWQEYEEVDPSLALLPPELQGLPQPRLNLEAHDAAMITEEVRPVVFEEVRLEADEEMRQLIANIKATLKEKSRKGKKGKKDGKKKGDAKGDAKKGGKKAGDKTGGKKGKAGEAAEGATPPKKKRKDLTAGRSIESIFAELACAGLVRQPAAASLEDFLGGERLAEEPEALGPPCAPSAVVTTVKTKAGGKKANAAPPPPLAPATAAGGARGKGKAGAGEAEAATKALPEPSLAQARQAVAAACVLPLGAHAALGKLQAPRTVLLYGPPGSGKTLLAQAVAHQAGAAVFDLSPAATAGKYPGKAAALMVHMVFKAARALAPSVVLLESADQVFVSDKTRARALAGPGGEPPNRIRKQLLAEVSDLDHGDGVLVLCTSSQPQACVKKDERALRTFIQRYIQLPLPDYGVRRTLLQSFAQRKGLDLGQAASLLSQLSAGLSAGQLQAFVQQLAAAYKAADAAAASGGGSRASSRAGAAASGQAVEDGSAAGALQAEPASQDVSTATVLAEQAQQAKQAAGLAAVQQGAQAGSKRAQQRPEAPCLEQLALGLLPAFAPHSREEAAALREWTVRVHQPLPPEEEPKDGKKKGGKKK